MVFLQFPSFDWFTGHGIQYELMYHGPEIGVIASERAAGKIKYYNYLAVFNKTIIPLAPTS